MKTVTIYKDDIIEALETEPILDSGSFMSLDGCSTCAVGAVVFQTTGITDRLRMSDLCVVATEDRFSSHEIARPGNYLAALSIVWEYLDANNSDMPEELRETIVDWAEENIPEDYTAKIEVAA